MGFPESSYRSGLEGLEHMAILLQPGVVVYVVVVVGLFIHLSIH